MLQGEFRYLTDGFGAGQIWGGILPSDKEYDDKDRKDFHFYIIGISTTNGLPTLNITTHQIKTTSLI